LLGFALAAGDADGDGLDDLLLTSPSLTGGTGQVVVFFGPVAEVRFAEDADAFITGAVGDGFGISTVWDGIHDIDGDGTNDLVVGASSAATAFYFRGPLTTSATTADADAVVVGDGGSFLGGMVSAGDLDGDDLADLVLGIPGPSDGFGAIVLYGPLAGTRSAETADLRVRTPGYAGALSPGDLDGDGLGDLLVTEEDTMSVFRGRSY
ncbi:MAG: hypothetical protein ACK4YP_13515, partial [Myxococcota bacterium]